MGGAGQGPDWMLLACRRWGAGGHPLRPWDRGLGPSEEQRGAFDAGRRPAAWRPRAPPAISPGGPGLRGGAQASPAAPRPGRGPPASGTHPPSSAAAGPAWRAAAVGGVRCGAHRAAGEPSSWTAAWTARRGPQVHSWRLLSSGARPASPRTRPSARPCQVQEVGHVALTPCCSGPGPPRPPPAPGVHCPAPPLQGGGRPRALRVRPVLEADEALGISAGPPGPPQGRQRVHAASAALLLAASGAGAAPGARRRGRGGRAAASLGARRRGRGPGRHADTSSGGGEPGGARLGPAGGVAGSKATWRRRGHGRSLLTQQGPAWARPCSPREGHRTPGGREAVTAARSPPAPPPPPPHPGPTVGPRHLCTHSPALEGRNSSCRLCFRSSTLGARPELKIPAPPLTSCVTSGAGCTLCACTLA